MNSHTKLLIALYGGLFLLLMGTFLSVEKGELEWWINQGYSTSLGQFFRYMTHAGDGLVYAFLFVGLLLYRYHLAVSLAILVVIQTVLVQVMKRWVFADALRPKAYFAQFEGIQLNLTEGVKVHSHHSFPSGHTATGFAMALFLTLIFRSHLSAVFFFVLAVLVGLSRIYLMQHFLEDVMVGAMIGVLSVIITDQISKKLPINRNKGLLYRAN